MRTTPDTAAMTGTYDTTDTAGPEAQHTHVEGVTAAFSVARATDLAWALRSMDAADEAVPANLVQTSPGLTVNRGDPDGDRQRVTAAANKAHGELRAAGYDIDPRTGQVTRGEATAAWMNHAASLGPVLDVSDDRSAG